MYSTNQFTLEHIHLTNHLRSHLTAIMVLDYNRLGLENKFLKSKSGRIFCRLTSLLYKILLTNLGTCKPTFLLFIHHIGGETVSTIHSTVSPPIWCIKSRKGWFARAVFIKQTSDRMQYFTILKYKLHSFNIQDDRNTRALLAKPLVYAKFSEINVIIRPSCYFHRQV